MRPVNEAGIGGVGPAAQAPLALNAPFSRPAS